MGALLTDMNQMAAAGLTELLNTLWYAAVVVAFTWVVLRYWHRVNAATRYWIWTAVLGFLVVVPFLPALVAHVGAAKAGAPAAVTPLATVSSAPQAVQHLAPVTLTLNSAPGSSHWPLWLLAVWIVIATWQLIRLLRGAAAVRRLKAHAEAVQAGALPIHLRRRVEVLASDEINSPVAVGYRRSAVIVSTGLLASLEEDERKDVLLHELAHLARYDDWLNLATRAMGAILVLHPLAFFVLRQIEREREMACDDFVVAHTGSARSYARSLARLHDLRSIEGTRLLAPALLGGKVSLADRIESLLRRGRGFSAHPSLANLGVSAFLLVLFLGASGVMPAWIAIAQTTLPKSFYDALPKSFYAVSVRTANPARRRTSIESHPGRFQFIVTPKQLILYAYNLRSEQLQGVPSWAKSRKYTIQAVDPPDTINEIRKIIHSLPANARRPARVAFGRNQFQMIQEMLADRFHLKVHRVTKQLPVYEMVVAKGGSKMKPANAADFIAAHQKPGSGETVWDFTGSITALGEPMPGLAHLLSNRLGRTVIDKTGLKGRYDFKLKWTPQFGRVNVMSFGAGSQMPAATNSPGTSIFTAIQEQLGLKLKPAKGPVQVLVVDHVEPPTPN